MTSQADLHVHSKYSGISPDWYFRLIQSPESYTEVKQVYSHAIKRGQTFVTITDHDQIEGALLLKNLFPERVFTGVECNVFFPEDHCKVHILVYGLDESQYKELMIFRKDIYQFRDYLRQQNLAYSVAHALMAVDDKLSRNHLEKLILLFDVFEGINGSQLAGANKTWMETLRSLTPKKIDTLYRRYHINPISQDPWIKGFTGGSDDHTDLFIGRTYTEANADTVDEFLEELKEKRTNAGGSHGTIQDLSMSLIKMAYKLGSKKPDSPLNPYWLEKPGGIWLVQLA
jgi:predicted metal-dependent phosphoesterase TrpH